MTKRIGVCIYVKSFIGRFWPMAAWIFLTFGIFLNTYTSFKTQPQYYYLRNILGRWLCLSRGTAPVITICSLLVLVPVCRSLHSILHRLLAGISSRILASWLSRIKYMHMVCAITLIGFSLIHTGAHIMNAINFSRHYFFLYPEINVAKYKGENPAILICTWTGYSGIAMLLLLLLMAATSTSNFRKKHFNYFYITHHLFVIYLILLLTHPLRGVLKEQYNVDEHIPGCIFYDNKTAHEETHPRVLEGHKEYCKDPPQFKCITTKNWIWVALAIIIYLTELICRKYQSNQVEALQLCVVSGHAIHLRIRASKNFKVKPGQYVLLQCSQISNIEWHPFTVTQCPTSEQESFELLIAVRGDWTKSLYELAKQPYSFDSSTSYVLRMYHTPLVFTLDGPFTSPMQSIQRSKIAICVTGGIGITAYIASLRTLRCIHKKLPIRIHLIWLTRNPEQIMWYSRLFSDLLKELWLRNQPDRFLVQIHLTKDSKNGTTYLFQDQIIASRIRTGRPNWKEEFRLWDTMYKKQNISVYCCGPHNLTKVLQKYCNKLNKKRNMFTLIHEGF